MAATLEMVRHVCFSARPGSVIVQLRERELPFERQLHLGRELSRETVRAGQVLCVNERADLAILLAATAVHLPESALPTAVVRSLLARSQPLGAATWISRAWHSGSRPDEEADALVASPVCASRKQRDAIGFQGLARMKAEVPATRTLFALGGVTQKTARSCIAAGAGGVAVIGAAHARADAEALIRVLGIQR